MGQDNISAGSELNGLKAEYVALDLLIRGGTTLPLSDVRRWVDVQKQIAVLEENIP